MTKVKICGLKRPKDIDYVNAWMPDYAGFVFAPSRRQVTIEQVRDLTGYLHPGIEAVGVFVDAPASEVSRAARICRLQALQLHGGEDAGYIANLRKLLPDKTKIIKVVRVKDTESIVSALTLDCDAYLFDTYTETMTGGSGKTFNWKLLNGLQTVKPYFLAGGLHVGNIQEAINSVHPYAVDISSGVETDGFKDGEKIQRIIQTIRNTQ